MNETIESYKETARIFRRKVAWVRSNSRSGGLLERAYLPGASRAAGIKRRSIERLLKQLGASAGPEQGKAACHG